MPAAAAAAIDAFLGPLSITLLYLLYYYALQYHGLRVKTRLRREYHGRGEKFDRYFGNDREMLAADRYVGNTLEHMPPFLILLWLHAVFVGALGATIAGGVYLATRLIYPFAFGRRAGRGIPLRVLPFTFTGYGVLLYFMGALVWTALQT